MSNPASHHTWPPMAARRFCRHRPAVAALIVLLTMVLFAFAGPLFWRYGYTIQRDIPSDRPTSFAHPFGTDLAGHDLMAQVMRGTQQSLKVGLVAATISTALGMIWGAVAGFYRGWIDAVMMRIVDVLLIVPILLVVLVLAGHGGGTTWQHVAVVVGLFAWVNTARVVRGITLSLREREFFDAARTMGATDARIIGRHLLPNASGAVVVEATFAVTVAILAEAALSFVGFGIAAPDTSLGDLVSSGQTAVLTHPWLFYFPGAFLIALCLSVNLIGDGLRDAFDPRR